MVASRVIGTTVIVSNAVVSNLFVRSPIISLQCRLFQMMYKPVFHVNTQLEETYIDRCDTNELMSDKNGC